MCKLKSAIVLKDRIFMPDYDSHDRMLEELDIEDNYLNASKKFVRVELSPKNGDVFTDVDEWELDVDQDVKPDWFDRDEAKERMRKQVKEWAKTHLFYNVDGLHICSGESIYIKDCENVSVYGNAIIDFIGGNTKVNGIYGNAAVNVIGDNTKVNFIFDNAIITNIRDNATVKDIYSNATVYFISGNAKVNDIYGNAKVTDICDNAKVTDIGGTATVNYIHGNAIVDHIHDYVIISNIYGKAQVNHIYNCAKVDYIHVNATIRSIYGSAIISNIYDNAKIDNIYDNAIIGHVYDDAKIDCIYGNATVKEGIYNSWKNINNVVLKDNAIIISCSQKTIYTVQKYKVRKKITNKEIKSKGNNKNVQIQISNNFER